MKKRVEERSNEIYEYIRKKGVVTVKDIMNKFSICKTTARYYIYEFKKERLIKLYKCKTKYLITEKDKKISDLVWKH